jgi:hypothetical protein
MSSIPIQYMLQNDTIDRAASTVVALNPGTFCGGVSSVPPYLYQSLKTLWAPTLTLDAYQSLIVADLGTGAEGPQAAGNIVIGQRGLREQVLSRDESLRMDVPGATVTPIEITAYKPRTQTSIQTVKYALYRIRYLLDNTLRGLQTLPGGGSLPRMAIQQDISIDPRFWLFCFYIDAAEEINAQEGTSLYITNYVTLFSR